jgi:hypothetical protein
MIDEAFIILQAAGQGQGDRSKPAHRGEGQESDSWVTMAVRRN